MLTPHPYRPPSVSRGSDTGETDTELAATAAGGSDDAAARSTALLMARHWRPVHSYAVICLASPSDVAAMVTAAAFHQVFDRLTLGESAAALRPRLLLAVRDTVRRWAAADGAPQALPQLRKPAGGRGMRAAANLTPENRQLVERSFHSLPAEAQCLLWHTEVEGEEISAAAALLGLDPGTAENAVEAAREKLREACVRAHRELAPTKECRFHNRLLDVPIRRGGALLPDVRRHLAECRYCRSAAEQLGQFDSGLGPLLAEAVLGWGARRYLDSRPGRARRQGERLRGAARHRSGRNGTQGRLLARIPPPLRGPAVVAGAPRALLTGVGVVSAGVVVALLVTGAWSGDGGTAPAASRSSSGGPGTEAQLPPAATAPSGVPRLPTGPREGRLRSAATGLCLDVRGEARAGAAVRQAACTTAWTQQWSYENDGLLRSAADPGLCLDSHADAGVVVLGTCAEQDDARNVDVRYDLTVRGELLPRWDASLALTTQASVDADLVVRPRDGATDQRWLLAPVADGAGPPSVAATPAASASLLQPAEQG
ncbi:ricin-type beta-trefoil lectin domain protein [Streptomyces sp. MS06]|uniref:ricin-type beta-trefoil lectin domain protein n=1 Tax=Streptomyces sp. MS06 TaxID=3385974 RepID=UPI0039A1AA2F